MRCRSLTCLGDEALMSWTPPTTATFADVLTGHWAFRYIEGCYAQVVVQSHCDGCHASDSVSRDHNGGLHPAGIQVTA